MNPDFSALRDLLCDLQNTIRDALRDARDAAAPGTDFAAIAGQTQADTIYEIDRVSEAAIIDWFAANWPRNEPLQLVMEGLEDGEIATFPPRTALENTKWKCILDPIDGTRGLMYDKRAAWSLAALAPQRGDETGLQDITIAAMTELPTTKNWRADQIAGVKGCGREGLICRAIDARSGAHSGAETRLELRPSGARDFKHGFAALSRFFPEGRVLISQLEEELWDELYGLGSTASPLIFDDQYISSGGQIYELLAGHDRMIGDLRPLALQKIGLESALTCHPYDVCTAFLLQEAGGLIEAPDGSPLDAPLDTTSPVAWMGYANPHLADTVRPILARLMKKYF